MRLLAVFCLPLIALSLASGYEETGKSQKQAQENQSVPSPVTVNVTQAPSQIQKENPKADSENRREPIWSNWALVLVAAAAAFAGIKTLRAIESQVVEMRNTGKQTDKLIQENIAQSASLERSVKETARFATAMEGVAVSLSQTAALSLKTVEGLKQQMRAYVNVIVFSAIPQDRTKGIKFQAIPALINNGLTPAHKVKHRTKAAILPIPLPHDFNYPLPDMDSPESLMGPRQQNTLGPIVDDFIDDAEVANVTHGMGKGLYAWGVIEYEDVFGHKQQTRFCQFLTWLADGKTVMGYFVGRNDGT